jgi:excisionase family DNA binding protein
MIRYCKKEVKRVEEKKGLMKIREVAARLGMSIPHAYRLAAEGKIPSVRMGAKLIRFEEAAVERFIRDHRRKSA